jgi:hypothetical protein
MTSFGANTAPEKKFVTKIVKKVDKKKDVKEVNDVYREFLIYLFYQQGEVHANKIISNNPNKTTFKQMKSNIGKDFKGELTTTSYKRYWFSRFKSRWDVQKPSMYDKFYKKHACSRWLKTVASIESNEKHTDKKGEHQGIFQLSKVLRKGCKNVNDHVSAAAKNRDYFITKFFKNDRGKKIKTFK